MRLLHTKKLQLQEFLGYDIPDYVILSHTWGLEEVTFQDLQNGVAQSRKGFTKLKKACDLAAQDTYDWIWIDTCCIDKSSSSELQEAINSMFQWYERANICYAYLADVFDSEHGGLLFERSRWWTRGWTLRGFQFLPPLPLLLINCRGTACPTSIRVLHNSLASYRHQNLTVKGNQTSYRHQNQNFNLRYHNYKYQCGGTNVLGSS